MVRVLRIFCIIYLVCDLFLNVFYSVFSPFLGCSWAVFQSYQRYEKVLLLLFINLVESRVLYIEST